MITVDVNFATVTHSHLTCFNVTHICDLLRPIQLRAIQGRSYGDLQLLARPQWEVQTIVFCTYKKCHVCGNKLVCVFFDFCMSFPDSFHTPTDFTHFYARNMKDYY